jgi:hypothetical protein
MQPKNQRLHFDNGNSVWNLGYHRTAADSSGRQAPLNYGPGKFLSRTNSLSPIILAASDTPRSGFAVTSADAAQLALCLAVRRVGWKLQGHIKMQVHHLPKPSTQKRTARQLQERAGSGYTLMYAMSTP